MHGEPWPGFALSECLLIFMYSLLAVLMLWLLWLFGPRLGFESCRFLIVTLLKHIWLIQLIIFNQICSWAICSIFLFPVSNQAWFRRYHWVHTESDASWHAIGQAYELIMIDINIDIGRERAGEHLHKCHSSDLPGPNPPKPIDTVSGRHGWIGRSLGPPLPPTAQ